jgi:hypothetical protein
MPARRRLPPSGLQHRPMSPARVGNSTIYVPTSSKLHGKQVVDRCKTIVNADGELCGHPFYEDEPRSRIEAHVTACLAQHAAAIRAFRQRTHPDVMRPWDPELAAFVSNNREAMIRGEIPMPHG